MTSSYNGWPAATDKKAIGVVDLVVSTPDGSFSFPGGCKGGDVHTIFAHFLPRYHAHVEPLGRGDHDEWGYSYRKNRNADNLSCHASGTAVDVNASEHPNGERRTLPPAQVSALRGLLAVYEGVVKWGGDFEGTPDEMHYEIHGDAAAVHRIAQKLLAPAPAPAKVYPTLKRGSTGVGVTRLQHLLQIPVDGNFGPQTARSVADYQRKVGLKASGVADPATLKRMKW